MRVYYLNKEYEAEKHKILKVWTDISSVAMPEDSPRTTINASHSILEIDERYNRGLAKELLDFSRGEIEGEQLPDKYYVDGDGKLRDNSDDSLVTINPNPQREAYKLSQLYGLTHNQLDTYIDNNVTNLAEAKEFMRKMAHVILWLVKQTKLDE